MDSNALEQVRAALGSIEHVERVLIDEPARSLALICGGPVHREVVLDAAREALGAAGVNAQEWALEVTLRVEGRDRERVRFMGVSRHVRPDHHVEVEVSLEWNGQLAAGRETSEPGEAIELRAAANAALAALRQLVDTGLDVRVGGVKRTRSFDADLMVASLYRPGPPPRQFVGAVLVGDDPLRAASVAVLSALNRHLGNFLARP